MIAVPSDFEWLRRVTRCTESSRFVIGVGGLVGENAGNPVVIAVDKGLILGVDRVQRPSYEEALAAYRGKGYGVFSYPSSLAMPGLIDAHFHLRGDKRYPGPPDCERTLLAALDAGTIIRGGFTTVRSLGHAHSEIVYSLRRCVERGVVAGPRILTSGWALSQSGGHGNIPEWPYRWVEDVRPRGAFADGPVECRRLARLNFGEGADLIKIYTTEGKSISTDRYIHVRNYTIEEVEAVVDEAHARGAKVAAHALGKEGALVALRGGVDTLEHGPRLMEEEVLELMAKLGTYYVPTISGVYYSATQGEARGYSKDIQARLKRELDGVYKAVARARDHGIRIVCGTDGGAQIPYGFNGKELELLHHAGLSPQECIASATTVAAEALGISSYVGSLRPGYAADIAVVKRDPIKDITCLQDESVMEQVFHFPMRWPHPSLSPSP